MPCSNLPLPANASVPGLRHCPPESWSSCGPGVQKPPKAHMRISEQVKSQGSATPCRHVFTMKLEADGAWKAPDVVEAGASLLENFQCFRVGACKRCQSRHEASTARVASASPKPRKPRAPARCDPEVPCQQIVDLLALFTKRVQNFFCTLMGFNHPHMERLQLSLQQHVEALGRGLVEVMRKQSAFLSLRSAVREGKLWDTLKKRQSAFQERHSAKLHARSLESPCVSPF